MTLHLHLISFRRSKAQSNFFTGIHFVSIYAEFFDVWIFIISTSHDSITSLTKWYLTSICFVFSWFTLFLDNQISDYEPHQTQISDHEPHQTRVFSYSKPKTCNNSLIDIASFMASVRAIYLDSVEYNATVCCRLDPTHYITLTVNTYPLMDLLLSLPAKNHSHNINTLKSFSFVNTKFNSWEPLMYLNKYFISSQWTSLGLLYETTSQAYGISKVRSSSNHRIHHNTNNTWI